MERLEEKEREASGLMSQGWLSATSSQVGNFVCVPSPHILRLSPRSILTLQHFPLDLPQDRPDASETGWRCCFYPAPSFDSSLRFSFGARHCFKARPLNVPVLWASSWNGLKVQVPGVIPFSLDLPTNCTPPRTVHLGLAE